MSRFLHKLYVPIQGRLVVGRASCVEQVQSELGIRALHRCIDEVDGVSVLRDGLSTAADSS